MSYVQNFFIIKNTLDCSSRLPCVPLAHHVKPPGWTGPVSQHWPH